LAWSKKISPKQQYHGGISKLAVMGELNGMLLRQSSCSILGVDVFEKFAQPVSQLQVRDVGLRAER
jgi:hypothetical protein